MSEKNKKVCLYCGKDVAGRSSYCSTNHRIYYNRLLKSAGDEQVQNVSISRKIISAILPDTKNPSNQFVFDHLLSFFLNDYAQKKVTPMPSPKIEVAPETEDEMIDRFYKMAPKFLDNRAKMKWALAKVSETSKETSLAT